MKVLTKSPQSSLKLVLLQAEPSEHGGVFKKFLRRFGPTVEREQKAPPFLKEFASPKVLAIMTDLGPIGR